MEIKPCQAFKKAAKNYAKKAKLQQAVAWRLAKHCQNLEVPDGTIWDFGAGSGHLARALENQKKNFCALLVDECKELLAESKFISMRKMEWDLNQGVPPMAKGAALIASSFALHWLDNPVEKIKQWGEAIGPGGWLAITVPVEGSFTSWQIAAEIAGVKCTAIKLPNWYELTKSLSEVAEIKKHKIIRYSKQYSSGMEFLKEMKSMGTNGGAIHTLNQKELKKLNNCWPQEINKEMQQKRQSRGEDKITINWNIMLVIAQKPMAKN